MIRIVKGSERTAYAREIDAMHRIRKEVFHDRLGWDVNVEGDWEIDAFDAADPLYVLSCDPASGAVRGSLRLLPTTGPNMLRDTFAELLPDGDAIESPLIWESSRFAVAHTAEHQERDGRGLNRTTGELIAGAFELGMLAGLMQIVTVYDARIARVLRQAGAHGEVIGKPKRIGKVMAYAGLFNVDDATLSSIRLACGIKESVLHSSCADLLRAA